MHSLVIKTMCPFPDHKHLIENRHWELKVWKWIHFMMTNPSLITTSNRTHCSAVCMSYDLRQVHGIRDSRKKVKSFLPTTFIPSPTKKKKKTQRPVSNPKLCKSCGMSPWSGLEEDSVWGISPSPGGLHLAPYPHEGAVSCCMSSARGQHSFHTVLISHPFT